LAALLSPLHRRTKFLIWPLRSLALALHPWSHCRPLPLPSRTGAHAELLATKLLPATLTKLLRSTLALAELLGPARSKLLGTRLRELLRSAPELSALGESLLFTLVDRATEAGLRVAKPGAKTASGTLLLSHAGHGPMTLRAEVGLTGPAITGSEARSRALELATSLPCHGTRSHLAVTFLHAFLATFCLLPGSLLLAVTLGRSH
jgi:hypothetical protein